VQDNGWGRPIGSHTAPETVGGIRKKDLDIFGNLLKTDVRHHMPLCQPVPAILGGIRKEDPEIFGFYWY
jgi:hypothetical protein